VGLDEQPAGACERSGVVVLAGGTGGAKLARGMLDVVGPERLTVIANTGDDLEIYGASVSPDPDLVSFWLADLIDERGWGLAEDTFEVMEGLRKLGVEVWFNLGDRDLAWCIERARLQSEGMRPTQALAELCRRVGVSAQVLPMCDEPVRTFVNGVSLQEFMIRRRAEGPITEVRIAAERPASVTPEVRAALDGAQAVIVGPSNPVISIWPILTAIGEQLAQVAAPVVCVSPVVAGTIVKGPTAACLEAYRQPLSAAGVLGFYEQVAPGLLDGMICDEPLQSGLPCAMADMLMEGPAGRARLAEQALAFAETLAAGG
jgi:LPPG:FO 2-phospho-L-lactate transferase